ncbi:MAG: hypothetical protein ACPGXK_06965, partial [Phycisphaerae bacterium]
MTLTEDQQGMVDSFLSFVEGECSGDDRYGESSNFRREEDHMVGVRFALGSSCWLEASVETSSPRVRVGFLTDDDNIRNDLMGLFSEMEETPTQVLERALDEAGLPWENPPVEEVKEEGRFHLFFTPLSIDAIDDLDFEFTRVRSKVPR